ncbi:MAG TPA: HEAT repeat domain-containing protein [Nitrospiraceae bacterium]|nr:HEAT repeat domain-containing protein [Nitrospiraceae bacterium]
MDSSKSADERSVLQPFVREGTDLEVVSVKQLLKLLDKAAKSARTYGASNPVARRFFLQFHEELTKHLEQYARLTFLIQRNQLFFKEEVVYQPDSDATGESIAFKMYSDGIRELTFHQGLTQDDLSFFLDALWGTPVTQEEKDGEPASIDEDDDIVTRLWAKSLDTITLVTAEELVRSSGFGMDVLELQTQGFMNMSVSSLRDLLDRERAILARERERKGGANEGGTSDPASAQNAGAGGAPNQRRLQASLVGYEVSQEELEALAVEIQAETGRDTTLYIIDVLTAILASERSAHLLTKLFEVWGSVLDALVRNGQWTVLESVLSMLQDTEAIRPDLGSEHKQQVALLFDGLNRPERLKLIEHYLNRTPKAKTEGLATLLLSMKKETVPSLCGLLANLETPAHQAIVLEALQTVAKENADPIVKGLSDKRPAYVKNLLTLIARWNDPRFADSLEKALRHPDAAVRREVLRQLSQLRPSGNGAKLVGLLADFDETVRLTAMKLLANGQYQTSFSLWAPFVTAEEFQDRSPAERRAVFQAMKHTAGDEAVPFWQGLLTEWSWTQRKKKEEMALLAADILGKLGTPAAIAALEFGQKKGGGTVRQACGAAISSANRQQRLKTPQAANS